MKCHKIMASGLNLLLVILPLLCNGLLPNNTTVEGPLCDTQMQSKYCEASFGGDLHTGCRFCGVGPQCPSNSPSARGLKQRQDLRDEILQRHNLYRSVVRSGATNLPPSKCLPELRWDDELSEVAQVWADQCAGVIYQHSTDSYPKIFHERGSERMTSKFSAPPGVGQNVAWALTKTVNFTKIIDDLWYRDISKLQPGYIDDFQVHSENQNVHLVTQMIWGRTTHVGCGWIQFPVESGSNKFHKIYPEGEYENFFVCNYGVGGNVPGEPVYNTDCEEEKDKKGEDENNAVHIDVSDLHKKVDQVFGDADPQRKTILQTCLDALMCLHSQENHLSCRTKEQNCIQIIQPGDSLINPATYFDNSINTRTDMLQCTTESIYCTLKSNENCYKNLTLCFAEIENEDLETTTLGSTSKGTSKRPDPAITVRTTNQEVTVQAEATQSPSSQSTSTSSSSFNVQVTTATFNDLDIEVTTFKPSTSPSKSETQLPETPSTGSQQNALEDHSTDALLPESRTAQPAPELTLPESKPAQPAPEMTLTESKTIQPTLELTMPIEVPQETDNSQDKELKSEAATEPYELRLTNEDSKPTIEVAKNETSMSTKEISLPSTTTEALENEIHSDNVTEKMVQDDFSSPLSNNKEKVDESESPDEVSESDSNDISDSDGSSSQSEYDDDSDHLSVTITLGLEEDSGPDGIHFVSKDESGSTKKPPTTTLKPATVSLPDKVTVALTPAGDVAPESKSSSDVELQSDPTSSEEPEKPVVIISNSEKIEDDVVKPFTTTLASVDLQVKTSEKESKDESLSTAERSKEDVASEVVAEGNGPESAEDSFPVTSKPVDVTTENSIIQTTMKFLSSTFQTDGVTESTLQDFKGAQQPKETDESENEIGKQETFTVKVEPSENKDSNFFENKTEVPEGTNDLSISLNDEKDGDLTTKNSTQPEIIQMEKEVASINGEENTSQSTNQEDQGVPPRPNQDKEESISGFPSQPDPDENRPTLPENRDPSSEIDEEKTPQIGDMGDLKSPSSQEQEEVDKKPELQLDHDKDEVNKGDKDPLPQTSQNQEQIGDEQDSALPADSSKDEEGKQDPPLLQEKGEEKPSSQQMSDETRNDQQPQSQEDGNDQQRDEDDQEKNEIPQEKELGDQGNVDDLTIEESPNERDPTKSPVLSVQDKDEERANESPFQLSPNKENESESDSQQDLNKDNVDKELEFQPDQPDKNEDETHEQSTSRNFGSDFDPKPSKDEPSITNSSSSDSTDLQIKSQGITTQGTISEEKDSRTSSQSNLETTTTNLLNEERDNFIDMEKFKEQTDEPKDSEVASKSNQDVTTNDPVSTSATNNDSRIKDSLNELNDTLKPEDRDEVKANEISLSFGTSTSTSTETGSTLEEVDNSSKAPIPTETTTSVPVITKTPSTGIDEFQGEKRTNPEEKFSLGGESLTPKENDGNEETLTKEEDSSENKTLADPESKAATDFKENIGFSTSKEGLLHTDSSSFDLNSGVTTSTANPVTSIIAFLTTFETPHLVNDDDTSVDVSFYNSTAKTSFRLALCLDGMHCKEDDLRCSIIHKECNEGLNIEKLPFQVRKKLSECTVDDILCHLDGKDASDKSCQTNYERCINIVIPEPLLSTVSLQPPPTTEVAVVPSKDETDMNPFFTLLSISKLSGTLKENESKFLSNISSSIFKAIEGSVGHSVEAVSLNSSDDLNDWLSQPDTLPIFTDITIIIPEQEVGFDENSTAIAHPEEVDFDLTNSSLVFDPTTLVIGNVDAKDAQILSKDIINSLKDIVHICHPEECNSEDDAGDTDYFTNTAVFDGVSEGTTLQDANDAPESKEENSESGFDGNLNALTRPGVTFAEVQIHLSNCLAGASCTDPLNCHSAQEKCIGKSNAMKFTTKHKKQFCECVVDFLLCSLNNATNMTFCETNVDSCLTMVIIVNGVPNGEIPTTSTQRSFPVVNKTDTVFDDIIENIAKNITILVQGNDSPAKNITLRVQNNLTQTVDENVPIILDKPDDEVNAIVLTSLTPQIQFKPMDQNEIVIDTSDLARESNSDRQKITQKRIENVLRQITGDFHFINLNVPQFETTSRSNAAITMSASTAFEEENFFQPTENSLSVTLKPTLDDDASGEVVLDFNVTVNDNNLFQVVSSAVSTYINPMQHKPEKIIFTVEKTEPSFEPIIMIQIAQFDDNVVVNLKISNETVNSTIFQVAVNDILLENSDQNGVIESDKLSLILEDSIMHLDPQIVELTPEEIAEVVTTFIDINAMKEIDLAMKTSIVEVTVNDNTFVVKSTEPFLRDEKLHLDLSNLPHHNPEGGVAEEVKVVIFNVISKNLNNKTEDHHSQVEVPLLADREQEQPIPTENPGSGSNEGIIPFPVFGFNISSEQNFIKIQSENREETNQNDSVDVGPDSGDEVQPQGTTIQPPTTLKSTINLELVKKFGQAESNRNGVNLTTEIQLNETTNPEENGIPVNPSTTDGIIYTVFEAEEFVTEMSVKMNFSNEGPSSISPTKFELPLTTLGSVVEDRRETSTPINLDSFAPTTQLYSFNLPINDSSIIEHHTETDINADALPITPPPEDSFADNNENGPTSFELPVNDTLKLDRDSLDPRTDEVQNLPSAITSTENSTRQTPEIITELPAGSVEENGQDDEGIDTASEIPTENRPPASDSETDGNLQFKNTKDSDQTSELSTEHFAGQEETLSNETSPVSSVSSTSTGIISSDTTTSVPDFTATTKLASETTSAPIAMKSDPEFISIPISTTSAPEITPTKTPTLSAPEITPIKTPTTSAPETTSSSTTTTKLTSPEPELQNVPLTILKNDNKFNTIDEMTTEKSVDLESSDLNNQTGSTTVSLVLNNMDDFPTDQVETAKPFELNSNNNILNNASLAQENPSTEKVLVIITTTQGTVGQEGVATTTLSINLDEISNSDQVDAVDTKVEIPKTDVIGQDETSEKATEIPGFELTSISSRFTLSNDDTSSVGNLETTTSFVPPVTSFKEAQEINTDSEMENLLNDPEESDDFLITTAVPIIFFDQENTKSIVSEPSSSDVTVRSQTTIPPSQDQITISSTPGTSTSVPEEGFFSSGLFENIRDILLTLAAGLMTQAIAFPVVPGRRGDAEPTSFQGHPIIKDPSIRKKIQEQQFSFSGNTLNLTIPIPPQELNRFHDETVRQNLTNVAIDAFRPDGKVHDVGIFVDNTNNKESIIITAQRDSQGDVETEPRELPQPGSPPNQIASGSGEQNTQNDFDERPTISRIPDGENPPGVRPFNPPSTLRPLSPLVPTPSRPVELNERERFEERDQPRPTFPDKDPVRPIGIPPNDPTRPRNEQQPPPTIQATSRPENLQPRPITQPPTPRPTTTNPIRFGVEDAITLRTTQQQPSSVRSVPTTQASKISTPTFDLSGGNNVQVPEDQLKIDDSILGNEDVEDEDIPLVVLTGDDDFFGAISNDANQFFDSRINIPGGSSANVVQATVVEDLNYARSVRDSSIGIATISSITVGVIAMLGFGLLIFLALARRRRQRNGDSSMGSPMVTPTQSRTTFSGSPIMGGDTPSVSDTRGFIDDAINTSSSAGSSLDPVLPIDGHGTIVTSYDDYMSLPENARSTIFSSLAGSGSGAGSAAGPSPPPPPIPAEVVPRTRDLQEHGNFLFARQPPNFHNPI